MGQYHKTVNLDKREYLNPHALGDGLKLCEQSGSRAGVSAALMLLLACSNGRGGGDIDLPEEMAGYREVIGRWAGDRIAVVGDYAKDTDFPYEGKVSLLYIQTYSLEQLAECQQYYASRIDDPVWADHRDRYLDVLALRSSDLFNDITPSVKPILEYELGIRYRPASWSSDGSWMEVVDVDGEYV